MPVKEMLEKLDKSLDLMTEIRDGVWDVCSLIREGRMKQQVIVVQVDKDVDPDIIAQQIERAMFKPK